VAKGATNYAHVLKKNGASIFLCLCRSRIKKWPFADFCEIFSLQSPKSGSNKLDWLL